MAQLPPKFDENLFKALTSPSFRTSRILTTSLGQHDVKQYKLNGTFLLLLAASKGNIAAIDFLVLNGADVNCQDPKGDTPLHFACTQNQIAAVRILLNYGADPTIKNNKDQVPFDPKSATPDLTAVFNSPPTKFSFTSIDFSTAKRFQVDDIPTVTIHPSGKKKLRVVCLSDTHARFRGIVPDGDILIHSGDISKTGIDTEYEHFNDFMSQLPHKHKILVFGNHDKNIEELGAKTLKKKFPSVTILNDQMITIEGINIYGSPWNGHHMAFHVEHDSEQMRKKFDFPDSTHILVTHLPPLLISDLAWVRADQEEIAIQSKNPCIYCSSTHPSFYHWGSRQLLELVLEKKPRVHQFGHVHDNPRTMLLNETLFLNAAVDLLPHVRCFDIII